MKSIGLSIYEFRIRDNDNIEYELHDVLGQSFIEIVNNYAQVRINSYETDQSEESVFSFDQIEVEEFLNNNGQKIYDMLMMRVKTGEYGVESEIVNSETGDVTYTKSQNEADVMPFGCGIFVPAGQHRCGLLVFQSIGQYGIVTIMKRYIEKYLHYVNNGLRLFAEPVMPRDYATKLFEQGILKSVRMIRYDIPDDAAERYGLDRNVREIVEERVIRKPAGFLRNCSTKIRQFFDHERDISEIIQIADFQVDDLKLEFQNGRRIKTMSLKNIDKLVVSEDITEDVLLENGHPTFESLKREMKETAEYYLRARGAIIVES